MITYRETTEGITSDQLKGFFQGWPNPPTPETHLQILRGSAEVVLAVEEETGRVVGFVNAVSDGVLSAYIPLLEVLPSHKKHGIGGELVRRMLARLQDRYMIDAICDPGIAPFYRKLGFQQAAGMMTRNYDRQSGAT